MKLVIILLSFGFMASVFAGSVIHLPFESIIKADADKTEISLDDPMYVITDVIVTEIETPLVYSVLEDKGTLADVSIELERLIALGKKVWKKL